MRFFGPSTAAITQLLLLVPSALFPVRAWALAPRIIQLTC